MCDLFTSPCYLGLGNYWGHTFAVALFFGSEGDDDAIWRSRKHRKLNRLFPSRPDKTTHCSCDQTTRKVLFSLWFCLCHPLTWHGLKVMSPGILLGVTEKVPNGIAGSWDIYTLWLFNSLRTWKWPFSSWIYPARKWWIFPVRYVNVYQRVIPIYSNIFVFTMDIYGLWFVNCFLTS
jgi:hypothetical protein